MTADAVKATTTAARSAIFFIRLLSSRADAQSQTDFQGILRAAHVGAINGADLDQFAFLDEERDIDDLAGFEGGWLLDIVRGVASNAFGGFDHFEDDRGGKLDLGRTAFDAEDFDFQIFDQILLGVADEGLVESDCLVGGWVHEMVTLMVAVAEFERLAVHIHHIDLLGRGEADIGGFAGSDVADDALNKSAEVSGRAVVDVENDGWVSVVADGHSFAEIIGGWHKVSGY